LGISVQEKPRWYRESLPDGYRLNSAAEAMDLDLDAMLENGPMVVEWADRVREALPEGCLWITMRWIDDEQRDLVITASGTRSQSLLISFRRQVFGVV
jgi:tRNA threonylcarbamoyladenosine biosynthesis protein TsaE